MKESIFEEFKAAGCDVENTLRRLCNNKQLYVCLMNDYLHSIPIDGLIAAIGEKNFESAFFIAHSIKGVSANLGLLTIYNPVSLICNKIRDGTENDVSKELDEMVTALQSLAEVIKETEKINR